MNFRTVNIIIRREYLNRVKKKSFLVTTFLVPVLMAALIVVPIIVMMNSSEKSKVIAVVDESSIVLPLLEDSKTIDYNPVEGIPLDSIKHNLETFGFDAVLYISPVSEDRTVTADITSLKPLGMEMTENIQGKIEDAVENYRVDSYNIEGLQQIMDDVKTDIDLKSYTIDDSGEEKISNTEVNSILSMLLGIFIFLFITVFGSMVMSAVIEEKTSRVVEVLVSSVKATELMFGKIIGIALVALTQFLLWIVLTAAIVGVAGSALGQNIIGNTDAAQMAQTLSGGDPSTQAAAQIAAEPGELGELMEMVKALPVGQILIVFFIYFILGYLLYASLFAAIGSAVENEGDSQQLQMPITVPLFLGYIIAIYAFRAPDSSLAFWGSMIPFTSPIVMLARIPFEPPVWEVVVSIVILFLTFVLLAWLSAKIYKVGILMFGKKTTWKDLWKWLKIK